MKTYKRHTHTGIHNANTLERVYRHKNRYVHGRTNMYAYMHRLVRSCTCIHTIKDIQTLKTRGSPGILLSPAAFLLASSTPHPVKMSTRVSLLSLHTGIVSSPNDTVCVCARACVHAIWNDLSSLLHLSAHSCM